MAKSVCYGLSSLLVVMVLSACGSGSSSSNACAVPQNVFSADKKLSIQSASSPEFEVIVRNQCASPGPITQELALDPNLQGKPGEHSYLWTPSKKFDYQSLQELAARDACVVGISEETSLVELALPDDPKVSAQPFLKFVNAGDSYLTFYSGGLVPAVLRPKVVIAIVDSGMDLAHEDLKDVLWTNEKEIPGNGVDDDGNGYIDDVHGYNFADRTADPTNASGRDHGTHVAGLAAAKGGNKVGGSGVAPNGVVLMTVNVFGDSSSTRGSNTANGIRYAADNGADVINLSLGGAFSDTMKAAIVYAVQKGVSVFAAAGNSGKLLGSQTQLSPAVYGIDINGLVTVGSVSATSGAWSSFSNYSARYVEIAAPGGGGMLSTLPGNTYGVKSGTSMATPVAAGAAALAIQMIRSRGFRATPARVELALRESGVYRSDLVSRVADGRVLNLKNLADYIKAHYNLGATAPSGNEPYKLGVDPAPCS